MTQYRTFVFETMPSDFNGGKLHDPDFAFMALLYDVESYISCVQKYLYLTKSITAANYNSIDCYDHRLETCVLRFS